MSLGILSGRSSKTHGPSSPRQNLAVFLLISGNNSGPDFQVLTEVRAVCPVVYLIPQATSQSWDSCPMSQKADKQTRQMTPML